MKPGRLLITAIIPAFKELAVMGIPDTAEARRQVLAMALQETRLAHRRQVTSGGQELGPAMSFWQFERGGGCVEVLVNSSTKSRMDRICEAYEVDNNPMALWTAMQYQDIVAAAAARLLLYALPSALPKTAEEGWKQYLQAWRPGKPHEATWAECWALADETVKGVLQ